MPKNDSEHIKDLLYDIQERVISLEKALRLPLVKVPKDHKIQELLDKEQLLNGNCSNKDFSKNL